MKNKVKIIAEVAQGFEGKIDQALLLAKAASNVGADAVKFQLVFADEIAVKDYLWYELFKNLEMSFDDWEQVSLLVKKNKKCSLFFDIFGFRSLEYAKKLKADAVKIHTTDFFNHDLVKKALIHFDEIYVAFGGISVSELDYFMSKHAKFINDPLKKVIFLYGFQAEPTPVQSNNILRLSELKARFPFAEFGFMDHEDGESAFAKTLSLLAIGMGVRVVEKHITLDRVLQIEDYISALDCKEFKKYVELIRYHEAALGTSSLEVTEQEKNYRDRAAKVVLAAKNLKAGIKISETDIIMKRTANAMALENVTNPDEVVGKRVKISIPKEKALNLRDLE